MSNIEWTDQTWNPVVGCTPVSPGCLNCYAATMANRLEGMGRPEYVGLTVKRGLVMKDLKAFGDDEVCRINQAKRVVYAGKVRTLPERLAEPLSWRKPRMCFVCSMSDLFHADVPFEFIDQVFAVMALTPHVTYQVLTKRPERMAEYLLASGGKVNGKTLEREGHVGLTAMGIVFNARSADPKSTLGRGVTLHRDGELLKWPLPNVWLGTSVEDQVRADERIPHLLRCPAAVRFLSCEPLLGNVDLTHWLDRAKYNEVMGNGTRRDGIGDLHWVIVGGDSGPMARPFDHVWGERVLAQCRTAGVPAFVKQSGSKPFDSGDDVCRFDSYLQWVQKASSWLGGRDSSGRRHSPKLKTVCVDTRGRVCAIGSDFMRARDEGTFPVTAHEVIRNRDRKGGDPNEWPEGLRVREWPAGR